MLYVKFGQYVLVKNVQAPGLGPVRVGRSKYSLLLLNVISGGDLASTKKLVYSVSNLLFQQLCGTKKSQRLCPEKQLLRKTQRRQLDNPRPCCENPAPPPRLFTPRSGVKVEAAVLGSPSPISLMVSVDVNQH